VTESELLAMADVALEGDVIETEERALIHSIIEFGDTVVREVMVPRPGHGDHRRRGDGRSSVLARALEAGFSRLPAVEQHVDDVVGIAYTKDMIRTVRMGKGATRCVPTCGSPTSFRRPSGCPT
jgi:putative hemolysin